MAVQKLSIVINDKEISVNKDTYLLKAMLDNGISVPTLCHHKDLTPNGACRLCTCEIEVNGRSAMVTACNYPVREQIKVHTHSEKVARYRKTIAEMYLGRWPNVPIIKK